MISNVLAFYYFDDNFSSYNIYTFSGYMVFISNIYYCMQILMTFFDSFLIIGSPKWLAINAKQFGRLFLFSFSETGVTCLDATNKLQS